MLGADALAVIQRCNRPEPVARIVAFVLKTSNHCQGLLVAKTFLHDAFFELRAAEPSSQAQAQAWNRFQALVTETVSSPPFLVRWVVDQVERYQSRIGKEAADVQILDHGCGSGFQLLYLLARGYTNVYGVDVYADPLHEKWNALLRQVASDAEPRFASYDGSRLPFRDATFDVVFSTQVTDHLSDECWPYYFAEEGRVLKADGVAFHEIPHRLAPYESHTRTWFLHYLPRPFYARLYETMGRGDATTHCLRFPWKFQQQLRTQVGDTHNFTLDAFLFERRPESFDGPMRLRRILGDAASVPLVGWVIARVLRPFLMQRLCATRRSV